MKKTGLLMLALLSAPALSAPAYDPMDSDCAELPGSTRCEMLTLKQELDDLETRIRQGHAQLQGKDSSLPPAQKAELKTAFTHWRRYAEGFCAVRQHAEDSAYSIGWLRCIHMMFGHHLEAIDELQQLVGPAEPENPEPDSGN